MIFLIAIFLLGVMISAMFLCIVFPIWTIIDCAGSERSKGIKTGWIVCMILFGFLASCVYVICGTTNKALRILSLCSFCLIVFLGQGVVWGTIQMSKNATTQVNEVLVKIDDYTKQLTVEQTDDLRNTLFFISERLKNTRWNDFGRCLDYVDVADQLSYVSQDKTISENDYLDITDMVVDIRAKGLKLLQELSEKNTQKTKLEAE